MLDNIVSMRRTILALIFANTALSGSAFAVGFYTPPCEVEKRHQDEAFESIQKCFEKHLQQSEDNDLSQLCLSKFQLAAQHYKTRKVCERKASILEPKEIK